mmetsp:Transcript_8234/g.12483  ORF Transcript_8234/g.12483 Transcript_8234/m.12483 type:complete len:295 (-) Transcript_8234:33-917(-)
MLSKCLHSKGTRVTIGVAFAAAFTTAPHFTNSTSCPECVQALDPNEWKSFPLSEIEKLSLDTKRYRVKLPSDDHETGLTTASCLMVQGESRDGTKKLARPYTPTTLNKVKGHFDLVIKTYKEGNVSLYMDGLKEGDHLMVKGPFPKIKIETNMKKAIGMIAGGTGITPMFQCVQEILDDPRDQTDVTLLYGSRTPSDILLKKEIDSLAQAHSRFNVVYKVDKSEEGWQGKVGFITSDDIEDFMPKPSSDHMIFICGPPPLMKAISGNKAPDKTQGQVEGILKEKGYSESMVYKF